jgi:hypothetical protein
MQKSELENMASRALLIDQALAEYGPEAKMGIRLQRPGLSSREAGKAIRPTRHGRQVIAQLNAVCLRQPSHSPMPLR